MLLTLDGAQGSSYSVEIASLDLQGRHMFALWCWLGCREVMVATEGLASNCLPQSQFGYSPC